MTENNSFTPEEKEKIRKIKNEIDLTDSQMLLQYGAGAKQNIADFSENILRNIRAKDSGYVGELMTDLIASVEGLDFEALEKKKRSFCSFSESRSQGKEIPGPVMKSWRCRSTASKESWKRHVWKC